MCLRIIFCSVTHLPASAAGRGGVRCLRVCTTPTSKAAALLPFRGTPLVGGGHTPAAVTRARTHACSPSLWVTASAHSLKIDVEGKKKKKGLDGSRAPFILLHQDTRSSAELLQLAETSLCGQGWGVGGGSDSAAAAGYLLIYYLSLPLSAQ